MSKKKTKAPEAAQPQAAPLETLEANVESDEGASEEELALNQPMSDAELELALQKEAPVQKFSLEDVASKSVKNWKPQWLPGLSAHARFHGLNSEETADKILAVIVSYGLQIK